MPQPPLPFTEAELEAAFPGRHLSQPPLGRGSYKVAYFADDTTQSVVKILTEPSAAMTLDTYADLFDDDLDSVSAALNTAATAIEAMGSFLRRDPQDPPPLDAESR
jgi:hypothetical protein